MQNITETLGVGSRAPDFRLGAANSARIHTLAEWTSKGPVMLEFLRGTWCHNCQKRIPELEKFQATLGPNGANLVGIAAEKREGVFKPEEYLRDNKITFPFLLDEDRSVTQAYGVFHRVGIDAWNIAHPATLVIDREGRVRYIYKGANQSDRAPLDDVLKAVQKLRTASALRLSASGSM